MPLFPLDSYLKKHKSHGTKTIYYSENTIQENRHVLTQTDLFNFLLITFDPIITGLRSQNKVSSTKLLSDAIHLLNIESSEDNESNEEVAESSSDYTIILFKVC
jgi:hypothetical protein